METLWIDWAETEFIYMLMHRSLYKMQIKVVIWNKE